jgi:protein xylosyltransferase
MRIGHIVITHRDFDHCARFARLLGAEGDPVLVHVDAKTNRREVQRFRELVEEARSVKVISAIAVNWASFSWIQAVDAALKAMPTEIEYVSLVSGSDYLVRPLTALKEHLREHHGHNFLRCWSLASETHKLFRDRFECYWPLERMQRWRFKRSFLRLQRMFLPPRKMPRALVPWVGSAWWTVTRGMAEYMFGLVRERDISRFLAFTAVPDELIFATLAKNSSHFSASLINDDLRYIVTDSRGHYPKTLDIEDLPLIIKSGAFYCRKINPYQDGGLCDALDLARTSHQ